MRSGPREGFMNKRVIASLICLIFCTIAIGTAALAADGPAVNGWGTQENVKDSIVNLVPFPYAVGGTESETCTCEQLVAAAASSNKTLLLYDVYGEVIPEEENASTPAWQAQYYAATDQTSGDVVLGMVYYEDSACDRPVKGVLGTGWKPSLTDLVNVANYFKGTTEPTEEQLFLADMNNDATITMVDLIWVAKAIQAKVPTPPEPIPDTSGGPFGAFSVEGLDGKTYTNEIFAEHELTIVNVVATWCGDCQRDLPIIQSVYEYIQQSGLDVGVIGVVYDARTKEGALNQEGIDAARKLVADDGLTFPMLIPGEDRFGGLLDDIHAVPTAFFLGRDGKEVAPRAEEELLTLDQWKTKLDALLADIRG